MATVTPLQLMNALHDARMRGGGGADYYGIGKALSSMGDQWDAMNRGLTTAAHAQDDVALAEARRASGYYGAQADEQVAGFNLRGQMAKDTLATHADLKQAYQKAIAKGAIPGTPEFSVAMHKELITMDAVRGMSKEHRAAWDAINTRAIQMATIKEGTMELVKRRLAKEYIEKNMGSVMSMTQIGVPPQQAMQQLQQQAMKVASDQVEELGLEATVDPVSGAMAVKDKDGQAVPIDKTTLATAMAEAGLTLPFKTLREFSATTSVASRADTLAYAASLRGASGTGTSRGTAATGKAVPTELDKKIEHLHKLQLELAKHDGKPDANSTRTEKLIKETKDEIAAMKQAGATTSEAVNAATDEDMFTGAPAAGQRLNLENESDVPVGLRTQLQEMDSNKEDFTFQPGRGFYERGTPQTSPTQIASAITPPALRLDNLGIPDNPMLAPGADADTRDFGIDPNEASAGGDLDGAPDWFRKLIGAR